MAHFDRPLAELERYRPELDEPADFDEFWAGTLAEAREHDLAVRLEDVEPLLAGVQVSDVTFAGFGGHPIKAWFLRPAAAANDRLPLVITYQGYGAGRGLPWDHTLFPSAGFATLVVDSRGQGWGQGLPGHTADPVGHTSAAPGVLTRGLEDPHHHYYRRLFTDAARAVDAGRALRGVDPDRVVLAGGSQGGAIAIAAAALVPDVQAMMTDVPFLQHIRHAVELVDSRPYGELTQYLAAHRDAVERTWRTISYLDGVAFAKRGRAPSLWSVALMDTVCPPSTVFASYNSYGGPKQIEVYPYNGHEGGGPFQTQARLRWLASRLG